MTAKSALLFLSDLPLKTAIVALSCVMALDVWDAPIPETRFAILAIVLSSLIYCLIRLQCGFRETVVENSDAKLLFNHAKSEMKFILGAIGLMFVCAESLTTASWREVTFTFFVFNAFLQMLSPITGQLIRHLLPTPGVLLAIKSVGLPSTAIKKTALIYGSGPRARALADGLTANPQSQYTPIGFVDESKRGLWSYHDIPLIGGVDAMKSFACEHQVDILFLAPEADAIPDSQNAFSVAEQMGVPVCVLPHIYTTTNSVCKMKSFNGQPAMVYSCRRDEDILAVAKRTIDLLGATVGILLLSPIMTAAAIAVKLTSRGSILFRQIRIGQNGAPFVVLKFRSMASDAEATRESLRHINEMSGPVFKIKNDPRVTQVGKVIRKYSIDELPQLFNVLRGDMALVGPRPALPSEVAKFEPWQRRKLAVKPGCTCVWQVSGRNNVDFDGWMKMDLAYIDQWSLVLDAKIIARTLPVAIRGGGY